MTQDNIVDISHLAEQASRERRQRLVDDMKKLMGAVKEAEEHSPGSKVNDLVNDLVEFMLLLTQNDCQVFSRSVRQVMDSVVDARSTHKDAYITTFSEKHRTDLTDHQRLVMDMRRDVDAVEGRGLENDIVAAIKSAGFEPRGHVEHGYLQSIADNIVADPFDDTPATIPTQTVEERLTALETKLLNDLTLIKSLLTKPRS